jgi:alpha-L-fucosidase
MSFGIIIHYGLYSFYAYDDINSAKRRKVRNGSEWYYCRLIDKNIFRPISGHTFTKKYHENNFGNTPYFDKIDEWPPSLTVEKKVKMWISLSKATGAKYIIITSKHHDGKLLKNML